MIETIIITLGIIIVLLGVVEIVIGIYIIKSVNKRFIISRNEKGETTIEPLGKSKQKMEFLPEMNQKEVEEMEKSTSMQTFLGRFHKPAKEEEEEEV